MRASGFRAVRQVAFTAYELKGLYWGPPTWNPKNRRNILGIPTRALIFHYSPTIVVGFLVWGFHENPFMKYRLNSQNALNQPIIIIIPFCNPVYLPFQALNSEL